MEDERRAVDFGGHYAKQIGGSNSLSLRLRNFDSSGRRKTSPIEADMNTERIDLRVSLGGRDESDWPILATALGLACAVWTEDTDFFGTGVAVWTTNRIEIFLKEQAKSLESQEE